MSSLIVSNVSDGTLSIPTTYVTNGSAKAWMQYLQAGPTLSDSFNVSSVTDTSTGLFTMNFTSAMSSDAYSRHFMSNDSVVVGSDGARLSTGINFKTVTVAANAALDTATYGSIDGDLA
jgi:hypothetical protein